MLVYFLRSGRSVHASAWMRILLVVFVVAAIAAVLYPGELTALRPCCVGEAPICR